jgi:glycine cleavage system regulatory protein
MMRALVMTVIGADRPGLVEQLSAIVSEHGGNWVDSRMVHLAGEFAGVVRVEIAEERRFALQDQLLALGDHGLRVVVQGNEQPSSSEEVARRSVTFQLVGQDRPGILASVTRVISSHGANVEELHSGCTSAPMTGETLFEAKAHLSVPLSVSLDVLRDSLEEIAADLLVDISLETDDSEATTG